MSSRTKKLSLLKQKYLLNKLLDWDREKTLHFIQEYEKRPLLWNKDSKCYHNILKKEEAWLELSDIFHEETEILKKKIESLRGSWRREKNRISRSTVKGKSKLKKFVFIEQLKNVLHLGQKNTYVSKWFAWNALKFLEDPGKVRKTILVGAH